MKFGKYRRKKAGDLCFNLRLTFKVSHDFEHILFYVTASSNFF